MTRVTCDIVKHKNTDKPIEKSAFQMPQEHKIKAKQFRPKVIQKFGKFGGYSQDAIKICQDAFKNSKHITKLYRAPASTPMSVPPFKHELKVPDEKEENVEHEESLKNHIQ